MGFFIVALFVTVGGLGGTFYVAYLSNAALFTIAVVFVINVFFFQEDLLGILKRREQISFLLPTKIITGPYRRRVIFESYF